MSKSIKRRGAVYVITSKGKKQRAKITGQGRLILATISRMGKATAKALRTRLGKTFKTENVPASVIGVYLGRFKKAGLLAAKVPAKA